MIKRPLNFSHEVLRENVEAGDYVIDATVGNGHDTSFLANLVGKSGKVYGFDIQEQAIKNTIDKLTKENHIEQVELINDGHENINKHISTENEIAAVTFNLGYLPSGDKNIITKGDTTISAIEQSIQLIKKRGVISIMIYYGHEGGLEEKKTVDDFVSNLPQDKFQVIMYKIVNQINNPPYLYLIQKI